MTDEQESNQGQSPELFRGHLDECLNHLSIRITYALRKRMADFCGIADKSAARWFNETIPIGETRIKLMCWLEIEGYVIIELERMRKTRRNFAELIGFGILSGKQASELLGYNRASALYQVLEGQCEASKDKDQKMWDLWKERRRGLEQKKAEKRLNLDNSKPLEKVELKPQQPLATISIMEGLLGLLEKQPIEFSVSELANLPQSSVSIILKLSTRLNILSSQLFVLAACNQKEK